jgi:hypothetical protein
MKALCCAVTVFLLSVSGATAQTLDETFDSLGSRLQAAQQSLTSPGASTTGVPGAGAAFFVMSDAPIFTRPEATGATRTKLEANTPVTVQGVENGFAKITTPGLQGTHYVPYALVTRTAAAQGFVDTQLKNAIDTLKGLAKDLQQNPYVRVKGFSVSVSISPSLNIDFEMRDGAASSPASNAPQTKP